MQYNQIFARLNPWYLAYCREYKQTPHDRPPIRVMYSARRMMDPNSRNCPNRTDRVRLAKHFASKPKPVLRNQPRPLDPSNPIADFHAQRTQLIRVTYEQLGHAINRSERQARNWYKRWCATNQVKPINFYAGRPLKSES